MPELMGYLRDVITLDDKLMMIRSVNDKESIYVVEEGTEEEGPKVVAKRGKWIKYWKDYYGSVYSIYGN